MSLISECPTHSVLPVVWSITVPDSFKCSRLLPPFWGLRSTQVIEHIHKILAVHSKVKGRIQLAWRRSYSVEKMWYDFNVYRYMIFNFLVEFIQWTLISFERRHDAEHFFSNYSDWNWLDYADQFYLPVVLIQIPELIVLTDRKILANVDYTVSQQNKL